MKYLFDENISQHLVALMGKCKAPGELQHLLKRGWRGKPDQWWMQQATQSGFIIVTADRNAQSRGITNSDLKKIGARTVFFAQFWNEMTIWDSAKWLIGKWDQIYAKTSKMSEATSYLIHKSGFVEEI